MAFDLRYVVQILKCIHIETIEKQYKYYTHLTCGFDAFNLNLHMISVSTTCLH